MRKLLTLLLASALGLLAALGAPAGALAAETKAVAAPPVQGEKLPGLDLNFDTVLGGGTPVTELKEPLTDCTQTSVIYAGQVIVFRMWGVDVKRGGVAITEANVAPGEAYLKIPGVLVGGTSTTLRAPFAWGEHSAEMNAKHEEIGAKHAYWEVAVPTKGKTSLADTGATGWKTESASGALAEIPENTTIEIPASSTPLAFSIHVTTKSETVTKTVKEKVKKNGKVKTIKVKKKVAEPGQTGEVSWSNFDIASQLVIAS